MQKDGRYESKTCKPEIRAKADGQIEAVSGDPYSDMRMVKVVDDKQFAVEFAGDPGTTTVSSKRIGDSIEENGLRQWQANIGQQNDRFSRRQVYDH